MVFLWILLGLLAYVGVGAISAKVQLPKIIGYCTYKKGDEYKYGAYNLYTARRDSDGVDRNAVKSDVAYTVLLWPYDIPATLVSGQIDKVIDKVDPEVYAQQQRQIEALERELEMR